jgi:XTP/dITP diphosphohydrolase
MNYSRCRWRRWQPETEVFDHLVVATSNVGKLREFQQLLAGLVREVSAQSRFGVTAVAETEATFVGNALLKARHAARITGLPTLADDSGLEVDALGGRPGVWSARYAGENATDADNNALLLRELAQHPGPRTARYRAVLVLVRDAEDPSPLISEGVWEGVIAEAPRGTGGFGYDPLFIVGGGDVTAAELPAEMKNHISHRAQALTRLVTSMREGGSGV